MNNLKKKINISVNKKLIILNLGAVLFFIIYVCFFQYFFQLFLNLSNMFFYYLWLVILIELTLYYFNYNLNLITNYVINIIKLPIEERIIIIFCIFLFWYISNLLLFFFSIYVFFIFLFNCYYILTIDYYYFIFKQNGKITIIFLNIEKYDMFYLSANKLMFLMINLIKAKSFLFVYMLLKNNYFEINQFFYFFYYKILGIPKIFLNFLLFFKNLIFDVYKNIPWHRKSKLCWIFIFLYEIFNNFSYSLIDEFQNIFLILKEKRLIVSYKTIILNNFKLY